jgi:Putative prokaryotic signal transducing protein
MILLVRIDRMQAYMLRDLLVMRGIKAHVFNENTSSIVGEVPPDVALPQVWLDDEADRDRAAAVLREYEADRSRTGSIHCAKCLEENPATFELCWKCGWSL